MPAVIFLMFIVYVVFSLTFCSTKEPAADGDTIRVEVSDSEAESVAMHYLSLAKVTGCGSFEITDRDRLAKRIEVTCYDGRKHVILNKPMAEVDGKLVQW
ncbi:hypothetical protein G6L16_008810 [Agrobacterium tumefaciens]|uniref:hypothetical protein n=1 Tax=Agrobacterium tumefaciens TaxID=358 RepID=UPI001574765D|nr:hypothetical protein [Agrobacterium tumefaciens]NSZ63438.1 hypothetical protein [Agrobacterium tumefaciens]NTA69808.1 hypothetical protein [Agrobacterium tumefaciens]WIE36954.1 hypothetical protein G6L16_008810 [Agrobacterium tumefaciens]